MVMINSLKEVLERKSDKEEVLSLEQMILKKLDEVAGAVLNKLKQFASGPETDAKFSEIETKVPSTFIGRELFKVQPFVIILNKIVQLFKSLYGSENDDALIVKRPIK